MSAYPCLGLENCVHINHNADDVWNDQKCTWRMGYICQYYVSGSPLQPPQPPADGACPNDQWLKYAGICYYASHKDKAINTAAEVIIIFLNEKNFFNYFFRPSAIQCLAQAHQLSPHWQLCLRIGIKLLLLLNFILILGLAFIPNLQRNRFTFLIGQAHRPIREINA